MLARRQSQESDRPLLVLRVEGGPGRGVGHVARCLALAQAWIRRGGRACFESTAVPAPWDARCAEAGVEVVEPGSGGPADWWVVDGYDLDASGAPEGALVGRIDDHALSPAGPLDLVVDQNLGASAATYGGRATRTLVGVRYALLRGDLLAAAALPAGDRLPPGLLRLVVAMGGAPAPDVRAWFADALQGLDARTVQATVLDGSQDPAPLLAAAHLALAAAGSTCWELCLFGVPSVLVAVADNQAPLGAALAAAGAARYLGPTASVLPSDASRALEDLVAAPAERRDLAGAARGIVDGHGADRVVTRMRSALLDLRPVGPADIEVVHRLNDEPGARAASFRSDPIPWADHERWFAARVDDPTTPMYLASDRHGQLVGLVRFAIEGSVAEIGLVVDAAQRGRGWGAALIDAGVDRLLRDRAGVERVDAQVKDVNRASSRAFVAADFDPQVAVDPGVLRYARSRAEWTDA